MEAPLHCNVSYDSAGKGVGRDLRVINPAASVEEFAEICESALQLSGRRRELIFYVEAPQAPSAGRSKAAYSAPPGRTATDIAALAGSATRPADPWAAGSPLGNNFCAVSASAAGATMSDYHLKRWAAATTFAFGDGPREWNSLTVPPPPDRNYMSPEWPRDIAMQQLRINTQPSQAPRLGGGGGGGLGGGGLGGGGGGEQTALLTTLVNLLAAGASLQRRVRGACLR